MPNPKPTSNKTRTKPADRDKDPRPQNREVENEMIGKARSGHPPEPATGHDPLTEK